MQADTPTNDPKHHDKKNILLIICPKRQASDLFCKHECQASGEVTTCIRRSSHRTFSSDLLDVFWSCFRHSSGVVHGTSGAHLIRMPEIIAKSVRRVKNPWPFVLWLLFVGMPCISHSQTAQSSKKQHKFSPRTKRIRFCIG